MLEGLIQNGVDFALWVQSWGWGLRYFWEAISVLGTTEFYLVVMPLIYWCVDQAFGIRLALMLVVSSALNVVIKLAWRLPRPVWVSSQVHGSHFEPTFGAPSGHSQTPLGLWGLAAAKVRRGWFTALAVALIFLVGLSRVALGLHFHFNVLAGWLLGGLTLWLFLAYEGRVAAWLRSLSAGGQAVVALLASLALIALGALAVATVGDYTIPALWDQNSLAAVGEGLHDVLGLSELITPAGTLFGFGAGLAWLATRGGFKTQGSAAQKALRYVLGAAVILVLWMGLGAVFPRGNDLLSYALRYVRYALVGFWAAGGAPAAFVRLGLAEKA